MESEREARLGQVLIVDKVVSCSHVCLSINQSIHHTKSVHLFDFVSLPLPISSNPDSIKKTRPSVKPPVTVPVIDKWAVEEE